VVVGGWRLGKVLDAAASPSSLASMLHTADVPTDGATPSHASGKAVQVHVDVEQLCPDALHARFVGT
jgi:hypothetical protein